MRSSTGCELDTPVANNSRLKRRLVSGAISENLDLIHGRVPNVERPRRRFLRLSTRGAVWAALVLVLTASTLLISQINRALDQSLAETAKPIVLETLTQRGSSEPTSISLTEPPKINRALFPLGLERVVVDAGHGGINSGTSAPGMLEKDLALDISQRLRDLLKARGFEVIMTRDEDRDVELADRAHIANTARGDLFISIHLNWLGREATRGVETYYLGATLDPIIEQKAIRENQSPGYSLTDFRSLLDGLYRDVRGDESRQLATFVQRSLFRKLSQRSPGLRDRGVKRAPFMVLIGTEMPAILAEVACLSDDDDVELLKQPSYRQLIAQSLFEGIVDYAASLTVPPSPPVHIGASPADGSIAAPSRGSAGGG